MEIKRVRQAVGGRGPRDDFGSGEVLQRIGIILHPRVGQRCVELADETFGKLVARPVEGLQGVLGLVVIDLRGGQVVVGRLKVRAQENGLVETLGRFLGVFVLEENAAQQVLGLGIGGRLPDNRPELSGGVRAILLAQVKLDKFVAQSREVGQPIQESEIELHRAVQVAQETEAVGQPLQQGRV